jgi:iron-sulfur cluster repair protein YtfE (RIC family)
MATAQPQPKSSAGVTKSGKASAQPDDAVSLLMADHRKVEDLFKQYEKAKANETKKQAIFQQINAELKIHMAIEEEIFYPASRPFVDEQETVNEAEVEHASAKDLMKQLEAMSPSDDYYDAKVKVLSEMIEHHVEEEETEYFPELRKSEMDLKAVGEQMKARKAALKPKAN